MTIYHLILEATPGLTTFEFRNAVHGREGLLPGFVAGYTKLNHDKHRHIGYGICAKPSPSPSRCQQEPTTERE